MRSDRNQEPAGDELDRRLSAAFADLADRSATVHQDRSISPVGSLPLRSDSGLRHRSRLAKPLLAAAAVVGVLVVTGWALGPGRLGNQVHPAVPTQAPTQAPTGAPTPSGSHAEPPPSQTPEAAARDGVLTAVARLPLNIRLRPIAPSIPGTRTTVTTASGTWVISSPTFAPDPAEGGQRCLPFAGDLGIYRACSPQYGELLLLSPGRTRILKAYPFPGSAPSWLLADPDRDVLYCGRGGDDRQWQSMVCRVDQATGDWRVRVYPNDGLPADHWITPDYFRTLPGDWKADTTLVRNFAQPSRSAKGLELKDTTAGMTVVDPHTLKVIKGR